MPEQTTTNTNLISRLQPQGTPVMAPNPHSLQIPASIEAEGARRDAQIPDQATHDWQKRYTDLQSYKDRELNARDQTIRELKAKASSQFQVPRTAEELTAFRTTNPDLYAVVETIAHQMTQNANASVQSELDTLRAEQTITSENAAVNELLRVHPDASAIAQAKEFASWVEAKGPKVQNIVYSNSNDAESLSMVLSLFKQETNWGVQNNQASHNTNFQDTLDVNARNDSGHAVGSEDPRLSTNYIWTEREINDLDHNQYTPEISGALDLAQAEGRITP